MKTPEPLPLKPLPKLTKDDIKRELQTLITQEGRISLLAILKAIIKLPTSQTLWTENNWDACDKCFSLIQFCMDFGLETSSTNKDSNMTGRQMRQKVLSGSSAMSDNSKNLNKMIHQLERLHSNCQSQFREALVDYSRKATLKQLHQWADSCDGSEFSRRASCRNMAKRSAVEQIVIEEKTVSEALLKLIATREKASAWHLKWAKFEEHEFLIFLFGKLAELRWVWNESLRMFAEKHQDYLKSFKDIYYEERVVEDTKKALQSCEANITKLKKQVESAQKKGDSVKTYTLAQELNSQLAMKEHLNKRVESHDEKMYKHKIAQVQKGLLAQAQSGLQLADHMRQLFIAQLRVADILGTCSPNDISTWQMITQVLNGLSDSLCLYPPPSGAVDPLPSPSESPLQVRKSTVDSPIPSSPTPSTNSSSGNMTPTGRRSFPFSFRPLPNEPVDVDFISSPNHISNYYQPNGSRSKSFGRCSSDITPSRPSKPISPVSSPYVIRQSVTILEEQDDTHIDRSRSKSMSQSSHMSSPSSSSPHHITNILNLEEPPIPHSLLVDEVKGQTTPTHDTEPGYADPIDVLRSYYKMQQAQMVMGGAGRKVSEPPYQTLRQIQQAGLSMEDPDDPTYSRPYDCLRGLPGPVRVTGESNHGYIVPQVHRAYHHRHRRFIPNSSGSEEAISSSLSPSPSPELHDLGDNASLRRSKRSNSLDNLLQPPAVYKIPVKFKENSLRTRVGSEGNLSSGMKHCRKNSHPEILSPLALSTSIAGTRMLSVSPQLSPVHTPVAAEITRLCNRTAKYVQPVDDQSKSFSQ